MHHSQGCCSACNLPGALKNTTPSSGEINLFDKSSDQIREYKDRKMETMRWFNMKLRDKTARNTVSKQHFSTTFRIINKVVFFFFKPLTSELRSSSATFLSRKALTPGRFSVPMWVNKTASTRSRWRTSFQKQA